MSGLEDKLIPAHILQDSDSEASSKVDSGLAQTIEMMERKIATTPSLHIPYSGELAPYFSLVWPKHLTKFAHASKDFEIPVREYLVNARDIDKHLGDDSGYKLLSKVLEWESDPVLCMKIMRYFRDRVYAKKDRAIGKMVERKRIQRIVSYEAPAECPNWQYVRLMSEKYWDISQRRHRNYVQLSHQRRRNLIRVKDEEFQGSWELLRKHWESLLNDTFFTAVEFWVIGARMDLRYIAEMRDYEERWNVNLSKIIDCP